MALGGCGPLETPEPGPEPSPVTWSATAALPDGRAYYRRKLAEGKPPMVAMRCLKRRLPDQVYGR